MYLLQSTFEAIERETKLDPQLVVLDFCNANRHRSVAKGTIMSCMLVDKGIEHGLLHLNGMNNWKFMRCGGSSFHCGNVDPGRVTGMAKRAFERFFLNVNDHDTSDSAYQRRRPLSVSVPPRSATPGPRSTSAIRGPPQLSQVQPVGPRLTSYEDVEVMVVARPFRGAEGMGAATVGKGHRSTTYTGVR